MVILQIPKLYLTILALKNWSVKKNRFFTSIYIIIGYMSLPLSICDNQPTHIHFPIIKTSFNLIYNNQIYLIHTTTFEQIKFIYKFQSIVKFWGEVRVFSLNLRTQTIAHKRYKVTIHNGSKSEFDG